MYNITAQQGQAIIDYLLKSSLPSGEVQKIMSIFRAAYKEVPVTGSDVNSDGADTSKT